MNNYITIKQAIDLTSKSDSTIRRTIKKAEADGAKIVMKRGNQVMVEREWIERTFNVLPVVGIEGNNSPSNMDMVKMQIQVINEQRNTIQHQQKQIDHLQEQVLDKTEKLELSIMKIGDMEKKLIEERLKVEYKEGNDEASKSVIVGIWVLIVVIIGLLGFVISQVF